MGIPRKKAGVLRKQGIPGKQTGRNPEERGWNPQKRGRNPEETGRNPEDQGLNPKERDGNPEETGRNPEETNRQESLGNKQAGILRKEVGILRKEVGIPRKHAGIPINPWLSRFPADPFFGQRYMQVLGRRKLFHAVPYPGGAAELHFFVEGLRFPDETFCGLVSIHVSLLEPLAEVRNSGNSWELGQMGDAPSRLGWCQNGG